MDKEKSLQRNWSAVRRWTMPIRHWTQVRLAIPLLYRRFPGLFWSMWGGDKHQDKIMADETTRVAHLKVQKDIVKIIGGLPEPLNNLLEVGCGTGWNMAHLSEQDPPIVRGEIMGCDFSKSQIEGARRRVPDLTFDVADAKDLPYRDDQFDFVMTVGVLVHIPHTGIRAAIDELKRTTSQWLLLVEENGQLADGNWRADGLFMYYHRYADFVLETGFSEVSHIQPDPSLGLDFDMWLFKKD